MTKRVNSGVAIQSADDAIRCANVRSQRAERRALRQARITIRKVTTHTSGSAKTPLAIVRCIRRANGNVNKIEACSKG